MQLLIDYNQDFKIKVSDLTFEERDRIDYIFSYTYSDRVYEYKTRTWSYRQKIAKCYEEKYGYLIFKIGLIFVFLNTMYKFLDKSVVSQIVDKFTNDELEITDYFSLKDINNSYDNLDTLLKYKMGVLQVPTATGKTEIISTLIGNILNNHDGNILVVSEMSLVLSEISERLNTNGITEGEPYSPGFKEGRRVALIKPSGFMRRYEFNGKEFQDYLTNVKYIIADEVETVTTNSFIKLRTLLKSAEYSYGFSATSNKLDSRGVPKDITFKSALNGYSCNVAKYFGFSVVNSKPTGYTINMITCPISHIVNPIRGEHIMHTIEDVLSGYNFKALVRRILSIENNLFIPSMSKVALYNIIEDSTVYSGKSIMISGDGCLLYDNNEFVSKLNSEEMKDMISSGEVKLVLGTMSSYYGIDFHGLTSVLLSFDKKHNLVKQIIGRLTRSSRFSVYLLKSQNKIPFLLSAYPSNYRQLKNYYSLCNLSFKTLIV